MRIGSKKNKFIKELQKRAGEVVNRARQLSLGNLPESLIQSGRFIDMIFWIIEPHVTPYYDNFIPLSNDSMRRSREISDMIIKKCDECEKEGTCKKD